MKKQYILFALLPVLLGLTSCFPPPLPGVRNPAGESILIFRFTNPEDSILLDKVVACPAEYFQRPDSPEVLYLDHVVKMGDYCVPVHGKLKEGGPFFSNTNNIFLSDLEMWYYDAEAYDLCELATEPKYYALHDGWYMCYPYMGLQCCHSYLNVDWEDICSVDPDTVRLLSTSENIEFRIISEQAISGLTKKGTANFRTKREQVTMDDLVNLFNELIDKGDVDAEKYFHVIYY